MFELDSLIVTVGYFGLFAIVFAESGLLVGFFLPGDSLLFTAGFLASRGILDIKLLILVTLAGAILGDSFGYAFGKKIGPKLFQREDSALFHKHHLVRAQEFYEKHGGITLVVARFTPIIRTFAPILAGVGNMKYSHFLFFNVFGGVLWAVGLSLLGYYLGAIVPDVDKYLLPIIALIIVISAAPSIIHILSNQSHRREIWKSIRKLVRL